MEEQIITVHVPKDQYRKFAKLERKLYLLQLSA